MDSATRDQLRDMRSKAAQSDRPGRGTTIWNHADRHEPGDILAGVFQHIEEMETQRDTVDIIVIEDESGDEQRVALWHVGLAAQWADAKPVPGDLLVIKWRGQPEGWRSIGYGLTVERQDEASDG